MDEIKISSAIEAADEQIVEPNVDTKISLEGVEQEVIDEPKVQIAGETKKPRDFDGRTIGIAIVALLGLFAIAIGGYNAADWVGDAVTGAATTTIVDLDLEHLHADNRAGQLDSDQGYMYNDFSFVYYDDLWWTEIFVYYTDPATMLVVPLHYGPNDLEDIEVSGSLDSEFDNTSDLYISIDPEVADQYYSLAISEISFNVVKGIGRKPIGACTMEDPACQGREIISCENNTNGYPVIELVLDEESEQGSVEYEGMCVKITGSGEEIVKAADTMLLRWYQVMN